MEKNLKNFITTVINTVDMFEEAKKALLTNDLWMNCVITQISNRLPKENIKKHLANVINNIANYSRENYPYPGYLDIVDTPNKVAEHKQRVLCIRLLKRQLTTWKDR